MSNFIRITLFSLVIIVGAAAALSPARTKVASASGTSVAPPLPTPASFTATMGVAPRPDAAEQALEVDEAAQLRRRAVERRRAAQKEKDKEQAARLPAGFVGLMLIAGSGSRRP